MKNLPKVGDRVKIKRGTYKDQIGHVLEVAPDFCDDVTVGIKKYTCICISHELLVKMKPKKKTIHAIWLNLYPDGTFEAFQHMNAAVKNSRPDVCETRDVKWEVESNE